MKNFVKYIWGWREFSSKRFVIYHNAIEKNTSCIVGEFDTKKEASKALRLMRSNYKKLNGFNGFCGEIHEMEEVK